MEIRWPSHHTRAQREDGNLNPEVGPHYAYVTVLVKL